MSEPLSLGTSEFTLLSKWLLSFHQVWSLTGSDESNVNQEKVSRESWTWHQWTNEHISAFRIVYGAVLNVRTALFQTVSCTCLVSDEGGERLQRSVGVVEAGHGFGPLEQQDVGHCHGPKPRGEAGGRRRRTRHKQRFSYKWSTLRSVDDLLCLLSQSCLHLI